MSTSLAIALTAYCILIGRGADGLLSRSEWASRNPRQALLLWQACGFATPAALIGAALLVAHDLWEHIVVWLFHADKPQVHQLYAGSASVSPWWNATAAIIAAIIVCMSLGTLRRSRAAATIRSSHRLAISLCGHPTDDRDVYLLETDEVAAYCVPGPGRSGHIIVTSAGRDLLNDHEMSATVEHERAHLGQRHHIKVLMADVLSGPLARFGLLPNYSTQTRRLIEMAADDHAAGKYGAETLASALLRVGAAGGPPPSALLAMSGSPTAERIRRLLRPRRPTGKRAAAATAVLALSVVLTPTALVVAPAASLAGTHQDDTAQCEG